MGILAKPTIMLAGTTPEHCADLTSALMAQETRVLVRSGGLADDGAAEAIIALPLENSGRIDARFHAAERTCPMNAFSNRRPRLASLGENAPGSNGFTGPCQRLG